MHGMIDFEKEARAGGTFIFAESFLVGVVVYVLSRSALMALAVTAVVWIMFFIPVVRHIASWAFSGFYGIVAGVLGAALMGTGAGVVTGILVFIIALGTHFWGLDYFDAIK